VLSLDRYKTQSNKADLVSLEWSSVARALRSGDRMRLYGIKLRFSLAEL